jgi:hypothetical protein
MNVKSESTKTHTAGGDLRPQTAKRGGQQNINTTQTPFTNIKTCNSELSAHSYTRPPSRLYYTNVAYGVVSAPFAVAFAS